MNLEALRNSKEIWSGVGLGEWKEVLEERKEWASPSRKEEN